MQFNLERKAVGATLTKYHVVDGNNTIVGSINVGNEHAGDLEKHWRASTPAAAAAGGKQTTAIRAMVAAFRKGPKLDQQAILRGC